MCRQGRSPLPDCGLLGEFARSNPTARFATPRAIEAVVARCWQKYTLAHNVLYRGSLSQSIGRPWCRNLFPNKDSFVTPANFPILRKPQSLFALGLRPTVTNGG